MTSEDDIDGLVAAWIEYARSRDEAHWWAFERVMDYEYLDPEKAWVVVNRLVEAAEDDWVFGMIAAGPLENLLVRNGSDFIDRIEAAARRDSKFAYTLFGVWMGRAADPAVVERFKTILAARYDRA